MKRGLIISLVVLFFIFFSFILISSFNYSGDGVYTVEVNDVVTLDNGWKIKILGIFDAYDKERIKFEFYDVEGKRYPKPDYYFSNLEKSEGRKKFGTDSILKIEIELIELLGKEEKLVDNPLVSRYEKAKINVTSIDELLPEIPEEEEIIDEEDRLSYKLTYKDGRNVILNLGESLTFANGYKLKFKRLLFSPSSLPVFELYDPRGNFIDEVVSYERFELTGVGKFVGVYFHLNSFNDSSVNLTVVNGTKISFSTGWNFFSIPLEDGDGFGRVLESTCYESTLWVWDNELKDYKSIGNLKEGTLLPARIGLWVKIPPIKNWEKEGFKIAGEDICNILISGTNPVTTEGQVLSIGWNTIGSPFTAYGRKEGHPYPLLFSEIFDECEIEKGPWQYISGVTVDDNKFSKPKKDELELNRGYFVKIKEDCALSDR